MCEIKNSTLYYTPSKKKSPDEDFDCIKIMNNCRIAYVKTIFEDKTIDAEAFIDNVVKEFNKKYK